MTRRLAWSAWACVVGLLFAASARADDRDRAKAMALEGARLYDQSDYAAALERFQAAYGVYASPKLLFDMARCEQNLRDYPRAAQSLSSFLDATASNPALSKLPYRGKAAEMLVDLERQLGRVSLSAEPAAAALTVDGEAVSQGAVHYVSPAPTTHRAQASAPGYRPETQTFTVNAGQQLPIAFKLLPAAVATVPSDFASKPGEPAGSLAAPAPQSTGSTSVPALIAFGSGGVLAVGAIGLGIDVLANKPPSGAPVPASLVTRANVTDALWGGAVVAGAVGLVLWLASR